MNRSRSPRAAIIIGRMQEDIEFMLPSSFVSRPLSLDDADHYTSTVNAISAQIGVDEQLQPESALLEWQEPAFDLASSSLGFFDEKGLLAAFATFWATNEIPVRPHIEWGVHPDYLEAGLAERLLCWAEDKCGEVQERCPPEARFTLGCGVRTGHAFAENALEQAGFVVSRFFYDMEIQMTARPEPSPLPAGFRMRPYDRERDLPVLVDVLRDSFSDHFGYMEEPFEKELELFRHWINDNPHFDPDLLILPADESTGEVAGCLIGLTQDRVKAEAGYIDGVGVRRAYRRRGLATAMLKRSFAQFWDRGMKTVRLDVDGESLTNAVALYERVGMQVIQRHSVYEKVLRDGVELAKVALE